MNKTVKILLIAAAVLVIAGGLLGTGFFIGRAAWGWNSLHPGGMMGFFSRSDRVAQFGPGMMGGRVGHGMMGGQGYYQNDGDACPFGSGMMGGQGYYQEDSDACPFGPGMMGGGMMHGYSTTANAEPLPAADSLEAVEAYLSDLDNQDLVIAEIMVFDNNSYAIIKEESTGIGAFELLVDPASKAVYPEYGPNMMWNLKYGMHAGNTSGGHGMMGGGMMHGYGPAFSGDVPDVSAEMTVSADEALANAQDYLDIHEPGVEVSDEITAFYGYYTIDLEKDGQIVGMLSVNGFNGQVFPHTWHGTFIEMLEVEHE